MTVSEMVTALGELSSASKDLYKQYKEVREKEDILRTELVIKLKESGLMSAKTDSYTASLAKKPSITVTHEKEVLTWLKKSKLETDQYIGLKTTNFKVLAMSMLKGTGEIVPGTEIVEVESLSVRSNKKK